MSLELEMDDFKLRLSKNKTETVVTKEQNIEKKEQVETKKEPISLPTKEEWIKSPLVGTFYASSTPNGKPYVSVGDRVKKGQVVCIIEAMKIMNEITSPYDGFVKEIHVHNAEVVGFNHNLIRVGDAHEK
ncbi:MAG: acetyl-CoA carboxylase, biotin carboxyl carrier protein [Tenericutes bacterium HGW-Tenericutes-6]|nr:MAG: acetyl-CoA carboxylase, biotin carboxyl carrier protein [Tenericutes bacterium HGW-Tenericutes-6]